MSTKCIFFWGHTPGKKYAEFSNWFPAEFVDREGRKFANSEQYMMWAKAVLFKDDEVAAQVLAETDPKKVKALGRAVSNFDGKQWDSKARDLVRDGCLLKFRQNPEMRRTLLETGDATLVEASPYDNIWGIGYDANKALQVPKSSWGKNWLGLVLMEVRDTLRREDEAAKGAKKANANNSNDDDNAATK